MKSEWRRFVFLIAFTGGVASWTLNDTDPYQKLGFVKPLLIMSFKNHNNSRK